MKLPKNVIGFFLLIMGAVVFGCLALLTHYDLVTPIYLCICMALFCSFTMVGTKLVDNEKLKEGESSKLMIIVCMFLCAMVAVSMVWVGVLIGSEPDVINYGGSGHFTTSSDNGIVFYQDENGWNMIIPDNYDEPDMNYTNYYTYRWNGSAWKLVEEE